MSGDVIVVSYKVDHCISTADMGDEVTEGDLHKQTNKHFIINNNNKRTNLKEG